MADGSDPDDRIFGVGVLALCVVWVVLALAALLAFCGHGSAAADGECAPSFPGTSASGRSGVGLGCGRSYVLGVLVVHGGRGTGGRGGRRVRVEGFAPHFGGWS